MNGEQLERELSLAEIYQSLSPKEKKLFRQELVQQGIKADDLPILARHAGLA